LTTSSAGWYLFFLCASCFQGGLFQRVCTHALSFDRCTQAAIAPKPQHAPRHDRPRFGHFKALVLDHAQDLLHQHRPEPAHRRAAGRRHFGVFCVCERKQRARNAAPRRFQALLAACCCCLQQLLMVTEE
jgi:hypothetical protein